MIYIKSVFLVLVMVLGTVSAQTDNVEINNNESEAYKNIEIAQYISIGAVITGTVTLASSSAVSVLLSDPEVGIPVGVMVAGVVGTVLMIGGMVGGIFSELEKIRLDSL
jgi:hypothetical protein